VLCNPDSLGLAGDLLHHRDGTLTHERDGHGMGAHPWFMAWFVSDAIGPQWLHSLSLPAALLFIAIGAGLSGYAGWVGVLNTKLLDG